MRKMQIGRFNYWCALALMTIGMIAVVFLAPNWMRDGYALGCSHAILALLTWARCREAKEPSWLAVCSFIPIIGGGVAIAVGSKPSKAE